MRSIVLAVTLTVPMIASVVLGKGTESSVTEAAFGVLDNGGKVSLYTLTNSAGAEVRIINYGAIVVSLKVPDRAGRLHDVVLGYEDLAGYLQDKAFLGAIVGRYANRIAGGRFTLDGRTYQLELNDGLHHLHGGAQGFCKKLWKAEKVEGKGGPGVKLTYVSRDGEEGYPGKVTLTVTYTLTPASALRIDYQGTTDKPTLLNPTHHSYFNLSGDPTQTILDEELSIEADRTTAVGSGLIPTGKMIDVAGTPMDFRQPTKIGARPSTPTTSSSSSEKGTTTIGFSRRHGNGVHRAAELFDARSGIVMQVLTDQPGLQFYSGNFLNGTIRGKEGVVYRQRTALCLEAQLFPDTPNHSDFPTATLRPGHRYRQTTIYQFSSPGRTTGVFFHGSRAHAGRRSPGC